MCYVVGMRTHMLTVFLLACGASHPSSEEAQQDPPEETRAAGPLHTVERDDVRELDRAQAQPEPGPAGPAAGQGPVAGAAGDPAPSVAPEVPEEGPVSPAADAGAECEMPPVPSTEACDGRCQGACSGDCSQLARVDGSVVCDGACQGQCQGICFHRCPAR